MEQIKKSDKFGRLKLTGFYNCCLRQRFQCVKCDFLRDCIGVLCIRHYSERSATQYVLQLELCAVKNKFLRYCNFRCNFNFGICLRIFAVSIIKKVLIIELLNSVVKRVCNKSLISLELIPYTFKSISNIKI